VQQQQQEQLALHVICIIDGIRDMMMSVMQTLCEPLLIAVITLTKKDILKGGLRC
jgi:hypothetical protein